MGHKSGAEARSSGQQRVEVASNAHGKHHCLQVAAEAGSVADRAAHRCLAALVLLRVERRADTLTACVLSDSALYVAGSVDKTVALCSADDNR